MFSYFDNFYLSIYRDSSNVKYKICTTQAISFACVCGCVFWGKVCLILDLVLCAGNWNLDIPLELRAFNTYHFVNKYPLLETSLCISQWLFSRSQIRRRGGFCPGKMTSWQDKRPVVKITRLKVVFLSLRIRYESSKSRQMDSSASFGVCEQRKNILFLLFRKGISRLNYWFQ